MNAHLPHRSQTDDADIIHVARERERFGEFWRSQAPNRTRQNPSDNDNDNDEDEDEEEVPPCANIHRQPPSDRYRTIDP